MSYGWAKGSDRRWRKIRERRLELEPRCRLCRAAGKIVRATEVDHVIPISKGGAKYDLANTQSLCAEHHAAKTTSDRTGKPMRIKGCDSRGQPRDPGHHWNLEEGRVLKLLPCTVGHRRDDPRTRPRF